MASVIESDRTGGGGSAEYHYSYDGDPAWAYSDDEFTETEYRTWSEFRGFSRVTTMVGLDDPSVAQLRTEALYMQGMHGDRDGSGGTRNVSVTDSFGTASPTMSSSQACCESSARSTATR